MFFGPAAPKTLADAVKNPRGCCMRKYRFSLTRPYYAELASVYRLFKNHSSNSLSDGSIPLHSSCDTWRNVQFDECHPAAVELARYQEK